MPGRARLRGLSVQVWLNARFDIWRLFGWLSIGDFLILEDRVDGFVGVFNGSGCGLGEFCGFMGFF